MKNFFSAAILRLTFSYLVILMSVSVLLSGIIYVVMYRELSSNLSSLYLLNLTILIIGGITSYLIAKKTIDSLEKSQNSQIRFIADASHELKTPLTALKSEIEATLYYKKSTKEDFKRALESAVEEADKMSELTSMLLELSRVNTLGYDEKPVEINHAIQTVVDRSQFNDRIEYKCSRPAFMKGNEVALETVFSILIDNALKYSLKKSKIYVGVTQSNSRIMIKITNQGQGITKKDMEHIFDHFYQGGGSGVKKSGYGMGLALAKEITEHHSGHINVKSTTGESTTFTVVLPKNSRNLSVI